VPTSMSHRVAHLTAVALVLLVGGCGDQRAESTTASEPSTTTLASTTNGPRPLTARERAWLDAIPKARAKIDNALTEPNVTLTSSKMRACEHAPQLPSPVTPSRLTQRPPAADLCARYGGVPGVRQAGAMLCRRRSHGYHALWRS